MKLDIWVGATATKAGCALTEGEGTLTHMLTVALSTESGPFDTIAGLPVHPLVVHGAVVLLPLAALGVLALVLVRRWRGVFGWLTLAGLAAGAGAAIVAEESGEALAARVGMPAEHAEWGERLPPVAVALFIVTLGASISTPMPNVVSVGGGGGGGAGGSGPLGTAASGPTGASGNSFSM